MKRKKLQDVLIQVRDGVAYRLAIEIGCRSQFDTVFNDFTIKLPWGDTVHGSTAAEAVEAAKVALAANGEQQQEKIIGVSIGGDNARWEELTSDQSAFFTLLWDVGFRLTLRDGKVVHFKRDGKTRHYSWRWNREIPWSQEAEDALRSAVDKIGKAREAVQGLVASEDFQQVLESRGILALPAAKTKETQEPQV